MAHDDLITDYLVQVRRGLRWHKDIDDLLLELEDHLRESVERRTLAGVADAERDTLVRFGPAGEVARSFALTPSGSLAVPTAFTRAAGTVGVIASVVWLVSAVAGLWGQGELLTVWTQQNYTIWSAVTLAGALGGTVAFAGALVRTGARREGVALAVVTLAMLSLFGGLLMTWAWAALFLPFSLAAWLVARRLRGLGLVSRLPLLLAGAWPVGAVLVAAGDLLRIGYRDDYGDYPVGRVVGYTIAALLWAGALALMGTALRREEPADLPSGATPA